MGWTKERARLAGYATAGRAADDPKVIEARRNLRAEMLAERIKKDIDAWPPLTQAQRDRLGLLLLRKEPSS